MKIEKGQSVYLMHFGAPEEMIIIEYDTTSKKWKCGYRNNQGSCYYSSVQLRVHKVRCKEYWRQLEGYVKR